MLLSLGQYTTSRTCERIWKLTHKSTTNLLTVCFTFSSTLGYHLGLGGAACAGGARDVYLLGQFDKARGDVKIKKDASDVIFGTFIVAIENRLGRSSSNQDKRKFFEGCTHKFADRGGNMSDPKVKASVE